jgi:hypothetical protein
MFDADALHPSHQPMLAAGALANAAVCLRAAEDFTDKAMRALNASYGLRIDPQMVANIGALAASLSELRHEIMKMEGV